MKLYAKRINHFENMRNGAKALFRNIQACAAKRILPVILMMEVIAATIPQGAYAASAPAAPSSLRATVVSAAEIVLTWNDNSDSETGFRIERRTDKAGEATQTVTFEVAADTASYTDSTLTAGGTYTYRVYAFNESGNSSYSNEIHMDAWDTAVPATLSATPASATGIYLAWSYAGTSSYKTVIERRKAGEAWNVIYTTATGVFKYSDYGLSPDTTYYYRIRRYIGEGISGMPYPNNAGVGVKTMLGGLSLSGNAVSGNRIYLTWYGNAGGADVIIERKMPDGDFTPLTAVSSSADGWYDNTGLVPGASYTYRIKARTSANESEYSNELTVQNFYLEAPSNLTLTTDQNDEIELDWKDNSSDETGFEIWRYIYGSGNYILLDTVGSNVTSYRDTAIETGVQYYYKVRAYIAEEDMHSSFSNTASTGIGVVNPPENLHYTYISKNQVRLSWTDTSDNESGFRVEYKIGKDGTWDSYTWLSPNTTSYTVKSLNPYTTYYFRVRAYRYSGSSGSVSNEITVSTAKPVAPSEVETKALSASRIKITWKDNSDNEKGFRILRKSSSAIYYVPKGDVDMNVTEYKDYSARPGTKYSYKVVAYNDAGTAESAEVSAKTNIRVTFSDMDGYSWATEAVENLAGMGIINGESDKTFGPDKVISKAEFAAMAVRTFGLDTVPVGSLADVRSDKWYYREVMIAENFGIISGDDTNRFYPEKGITREEIAVMLFRALEVSGSEYTGYDNAVLEKYSDKNLISPYALSSMAALVGEGIMEGLTNDTLGPKSIATRAQAAVYLYRAMEV